MIGGDSWTLIKKDSLVIVHTKTVHHCQKGKRWGRDVSAHRPFLVLSERVESTHCLLGWSKAARHWHGTSLVSWRSKKQYVVFHSSIVAEYRAFVGITSDIFWLWWLLANLDAPQPTKTPFYCDNRNVIYLAHNDLFHEHTKHIKIDGHVTHQDLMNGNLWLNLLYWPTCWYLHQDSPT